MMLSFCLQIFVNERSMIQIKSEKRFTVTTYKNIFFLDWIETLHINYSFYLLHSKYTWLSTVESF